MPLAQDVGCATCPSTTLTMSMPPQFGFGAPHPEPVAEYLDRWHHGHILNTLDEKVFHRQVSALIGGHWVGPRIATVLAAHFRSSKGTHGHFLNAHASI